MNLISKPRPITARIESEGRPRPLKMLSMRLAKPRRNFNRIKGVPNEVRSMKQKMKLTL